MVKYPLYLKKIFGVPPAVFKNTLIDCNNTPVIFENTPTGCNNTPMIFENTPTVYNNTPMTRGVPKMIQRHKM
jgi:hypothetical protein